MYVYKVSACVCVSQRKRKCVCVFVSACVSLASQKIYVYSLGETFLKMFADISSCCFRCKGVTPRTGDSKWTLPNAMEVLSGPQAPLTSKIPRPSLDAEGLKGWYTQLRVGVAAPAGAGLENVAILIHVRTPYQLSLVTSIGSVM